MKIKPKNSDEWYRIDGDNTLRLNYENLNSNSTVVDIGARHGAWACPIKEMYGCDVICFDVIEEYVENLKQLGFTSYRYAVSDTNGVLSLGIDGDEASIYHEYDIFQVESIDTNKLFNLLKVDKIDLIKMNVEGSEYDIIKNLIDNNLINKIDNLQIQFHEMVGCEEKYSNLEASLMKTHELTWRYPFIWENWKRKIDNIS
jgi:FkbM family methyltransferase